MEITPEDCGAVGDGLADDTAAWQAALASGSSVSGTQGAVYYTTGPLGAPASGTTIDLNGSKIVADWEQAGSVYQAVFFIAGKDHVTIKNGSIEYIGTFDNGSDYAGLVSGIHANECDYLLVDGVEASGFSRAGIFVGAMVDGSALADAQSPKIIRCHCHHNRVAGVMFGATDNGEVAGCNLHWNGLVTSIGTGYGFAGWEAYLPKNTILRGNHANDNYRKGLDFHSGGNGTIIGNVCARNRNDGIYATGVTGHWVITGNIIDDMLWDNTFPTSTMYGIRVGALVGQGVAEIPTTFVISGNTISNFRLTAGTAYAITCYGVGLSYGMFNITGNILRLGRVTKIVTSSIAVSGGAAGNYYDWMFNDNTVYCAQTDSTPFDVLSANNRKKQFSDNSVVIEAASGGTYGVFNYASTNIPGRGLVASGNDITAPVAIWSAVYDAINVKRVTYERMEGNIVNGVSWRDWDGSRFIGRGAGVAPPADGKYWTVGSVWHSANIAAGGSPGGYCVAAGVTGAWKNMAAIAA